MKYCIIVTIYNKESYLEKCLTSIFNQSYTQEFQIIIINDGSTDKSDEKIKGYQKNHKFEYYKFKNRGIATSRNEAIKLVKAEYFLFVDGDDYIERDLLKTIDKYLTKKQIEILSFSAVEEKNNQIVKKLSRPISTIVTGQETLKAYIDQGTLFTVPWGYVYNTKFFKDSNILYPDREILEDFYLTPLLLSITKKIKTINYEGYYYVQTQDSIMRNNNYATQIKIVETYTRHLSKIIVQLDSKNLEYKVKNQLIKYLFLEIFWYGLFMKRKESKKLYIELKKINEVKKINIKNSLFILMKLNNVLGINFYIKKIIKKYLPKLQIMSIFKKNNM